METTYLSMVSRLVNPRGFILPIAQVLDDSMHRSNHSSGNIICLYIYISGIRPRGVYRRAMQGLGRSRGIYKVYYKASVRSNSHPSMAHRV